MPARHIKNGLRLQGFYFSNEISIPNLDYEKAAIHILTTMDPNDIPDQPITISEERIVSFFTAVLSRRDDFMRVRGSNAFWAMFMKDWPTVSNGSRIRPKHTKAVVNILCEARRVFRRPDATDTVLTQLVDEYIKLEFDASQAPWRERFMES